MFDSSSSQKLPSPQPAIDKIEVLQEIPILINVIYDDIGKAYKVFLPTCFKRLEHWPRKVISWLGEISKESGSVTSA